MSPHSPILDNACHEPIRADLVLADRQILWHPFTQMAEYEPLIIERAHGCTLVEHSDWETEMQPGRATMLLLAAVMYCTAGCLPSGQDSWEHFQGGGHFSTGSPSVSADGSRIVYASPRSGHGDIYCVLRDGAAEARLTSDEHFESDPLYSPDGSTIAFLREQEGLAHIWLMNTDGTQQREFTKGRVIDQIGSFSPDGQWLIYGTGSPSGGMGLVLEWVVRRLDQSGEVIPIGYGGCFSADGRAVYYCRSDQAEEIWRRELSASGSSRRIASGCAVQASPVGSKLLVTRRNPNQPTDWSWWLVDADGNDAQRVTGLQHPVFSSDGRQLIGFGPDYSFELRRLDLETGQCHVVNAPSGYKTAPRACPGGLVFLLYGSGRYGDVCVLRDDTWTVERLTPVE